MSAWGKGGLAKSCNSLLSRVEQNDPSLVDLVILPSKEFGGSEVKRLSKAIGDGKNTYLRSISASGHKLSSCSLKELSQAITSTSLSKKENKVGIKSIAIGDKNMGDEGVKSFCGPLQDCNGGSLEHVDLSWKNITNESMAILGSTFGLSENLQQLNLSRNKFGSIGLKCFYDAVVQKYEASLGTSALPSLQKLYLSECEIGSDGMKALCECLLMTNNGGKNLTLDLYSNPIGGGDNESIVSIYKMGCLSGVLSSLSIQNCNIGNAGIHKLTNLISMESEIESGSQHGGLQFLDLSNNSIGEDGAKLLGQSFSSHKATVFWSKLKELRVGGNKSMNPDGISELCDGIDKLGNVIKVLDLSQTSCGSKGAISALKLEHLESLRLFNNELGSKVKNNLDGDTKEEDEESDFDKIIPFIISASNLVSLDLCGNKVKENSIVKLLNALLSQTKSTVETSHLRVLELGGNEIGQEAEMLLKELAIKRPNLDIARDRPKAPNEPE